MKSAWKIINLSKVVYKKKLIFMTSSRGDDDVKYLFYKNKTIEQTIISKTRGPKLL